jgi:hypothetical protein
MKRRQFNFHYCSQCKGTTRHTEDVAVSTCLNCGTVKPVVRITRHSTYGHQERDLQWG